MAVTEAIVDAFRDHVRRRVVEGHCGFGPLWGTVNLFRYRHEGHMKGLELLLKTLEAVKGLGSRGGITH